MSKGFYVYIHTRIDTGEVFYVGKGSGRRFSDRFGRSNYWNRIASKAGWIPSIVQSNMSEEDAFLLESWLIAKFRHNGVKLSNISEGGDGGSSGVPAVNRRVVFCSNGMKFESLVDASLWLRGLGHTKATSKRISACALGHSETAYGYAWSYNSVPEAPKMTWQELASSRKREVAKGVCCSNGMQFESVSEAILWLNSIGWTKASQGGMSSCLTGRTRTAYGYSWKYKD